MWLGEGGFIKVDQYFRPKELKKRKKGFGTANYINIFWL